MTNEIKEILDSLKFVTDNPTLEDEVGDEQVTIINYTELNAEESKRLLDYITNLQDKLYFMIGRSDEKQEIIDKALEEINYMKTNMDITEIGALKLEQILKGE